MEPTLFDVERIIALNLRTQTGTKTVRVRFPSDEAWIKRQKRRKVIVKQLGRGRSQTEVIPCEDYDAELIQSLRVEEKDAPEIDKFEAARVLEILATAEVEDVSDEPGGFAVTLRVLGGKATHYLRMPSEEDRAQYRRSFADVVDLPYGKQQITVNIGAAADIYKRLAVSSGGYSGAVPIIHQSAALKATLDALDACFAEDQGENF
jgi:hypothetical protein